MAKTAATTVDVQESTLKLATSQVQDEDGEHALVVREITFDIDFSDLGSGASDTISITGFPANVLVVGGWVEVNTAFAGEADLAMSVGDAGDVDEILVSLTIDGVAAGRAAFTTGAMVFPQFEAAYAPIATLTATELDDVTAGNLTIHLLYMDTILDT